MKKIFALVATASLLFSCSKEEEVTPKSEKLPINISMGVQTRANDSTYENGDEVGIYVVNYNGSTAGALAVSGNQVDNMRFAYNNGTWTPDETIYWKDQNTAADFYAYYPYSESANISAYSFSVNTDQSNEVDFWASDFLWGKTSRVIPTPDAVPIKTKHILSRILIDIKPNGFTADAWANAAKSVKICDIKTDATIDLSTGIATASGNNGEIRPLIVSQTNSTISYKAMLIPQVVTDDSKLIVVTVDGVDYIYRQGYEFRANTQHRFSITVNKAEGSVDITIEDWDMDYITNVGDANVEEEESYSVADAVDLGLSVKWATWNVGASAPEEFGDYYAWGECEIKYDYWWDSYKYYTESRGITKYCTSNNQGAIIDNKTSLEPTDDVASVKWGEEWRMPTLEECAELVNNCTWEYTNINGVSGYTVTGPNGNSIFLPAAGFREYADFCPQGQAQSNGLYGFYWSKSLHPYYSCQIASGISFDSTTIQSDGWNRRTNGHTIRPVFGSETSQSQTIPNNQIWYTSTDETIVDPSDTEAFGANIISNTYENGKGIITFDGDVLTVGDLAFDSCSNITSIILPNKVTSIGYAFRSCTNLTTITIPDSVTSIFAGAFERCDNLVEFKSKYASNDGRCLIMNGELISFARSGISAYTIPDDVTTIGGAVFAFCENLVDITIPNTVTKIADSAFVYCISIQSIVLPNSITTIEQMAFYGCSSLQSIYFKSAIPPTIANDLFNGVENFSIYVPAESVDSYKEASEYWSALSDRIIADTNEN